MPSCSCKYFANPVSCRHTFFGCSPTLPPSPPTPKGEKGDFIRTPPLLDISQLIAATEDGEVTVAIKTASEPDSEEGRPLKSDDVIKNEVNQDKVAPSLNPTSVSAFLGFLKGHTSDRRVFYPNRFVASTEGRMQQTFLCPRRS